MSAPTDPDVTRWLDEAATGFVADDDLRERVDRRARRQARRARAVVGASTATLVLVVVATLVIGRGSEIVTAPGSPAPSPAGSVTAVTTSGTFHPSVSSTVPAPVAPSDESPSSTPVGAAVVTTPPPDARPLEVPPSSAPATPDVGAPASPTESSPCDGTDPRCGQPCPLAVAHWSGYTIDADHPGPISVELRLFEASCEPVTDLTGYDLSVSSSVDGIVLIRQWTADRFHVELDPVANGRTVVTIVRHKAGDNGGGSFSAPITVDVPGLPTR